MATGTSALRRRSHGRDVFFVVRLVSATSGAEMITVLHYVPSGTAELASFDNANGALDYAEAMVCALRANGSQVELVDPPYGLVGTG